MIFWLHHHDAPSIAVRQSASLTLSLTTSGATFVSRARFPDLRRAQELAAAELKACMHWPAAVLQAKDDLTRPQAADGRLRTRC
jgi:hypothetical protein